MDEKIEAAARALHQAWNLPLSRWDDLTGPMQRFWLDTARAALEAAGWFEDREYLMMLQADLANAQEARS